MRELVFTCAIAFLGSGCVQVVSHVDEYDAGPDVKPSDGSAEAETGPVGACMSGDRWLDGIKPGFPQKTPGRGCLNTGCHSSTSKVPLTVGGTIYGALHDVDDCYGVDGTGYAVAILDEAGMDIPGFSKLFVGPSGNFYTNKALPPNFKVKVIKGGIDTAMIAPISDGNCNACHTAEGTKGAKGRIIAN
jgi:hypothetical protein